MSFGWRLVLTALLLLALPLKGLAAVGVVGCAGGFGPSLVAPASLAVPVPGASAAQPHDPAEAPCAEHAGHDHDGASVADDGDTDAHGPCHHGAPCCMSLAMAAVPSLALAELPRHAPPATVARPADSAPLAGLERPPRA